MNAIPPSESASKTHPLGAGTVNMGVNVKKEFKDSCFAAACDERVRLSDWMRAAMEEKLERARLLKEGGQLQLEGVKV